jgi:hypothetical protein
MTTEDKPEQGKIYSLFGGAATRSNCLTKKKDPRAPPPTGGGKLSCFILRKYPNWYRQANVIVLK